MTGVGAGRVGQPLADPSRSSSNGPAGTGGSGQGQRRVTAGEVAEAGEGPPGDDECGVLVAVSLVGEPDALGVLLLPEDAARPG